VTQTVLVLGAYGFFGQRICAALARNQSLRVLIAGRDLSRGMTAARAMGLPPGQAVCLNAQDPNLAGTLRGLQVDVLIHAAGPFQGQDYTVARAAIDAGCHYIDLADGRQFVAGIAALDLAAKERGLTITSGASSVPALSSAVVDRYLPEFERLDSIRVGISSGARAPGLATVRGVFSYAGKPVSVLQDGSWATAFGWRGLERHQFPSPLGRRWLGTCEVPDLDVLPRRYPTVKTVTFQAGFASDGGHLVVWTLAGLVKAGLLANMMPFASPLNRLSRWIEPLVSDKGGMFVTLEGTGRNGQPRIITWNIISGHNHGPFIPCGASIVLATKIADGVKLPVGAMPCVGLLTVAEYIDALKGLDVKEVVQ
jgi:saccharopine dehydrogenase-like NADP-dependent oxidoreductase